MVGKSVVLDTNIILRFLLQDNKEQVSKIEKLFTKFKKNKTVLFVPQIVMFEIVFNLEKYYCIPKKEILRDLRAILGTSFLEIQDKLSFSEAIKIYEISSVSFVDCFLLAISQTKDFELMTFDQKLKRLVKSSSI